MNRFVLSSGEVKHLENVMESFYMIMPLEAYRSGVATKPTPLRIVMAEAKYRGTHIDVARLTEEEVQEVLLLMPPYVTKWCEESAREALRRILVTEENEPSPLDESNLRKINWFLKGKTINGRHYRMARDHGLHQLWEVEPPTD